MSKQTLQEHTNTQLALLGGAATLKRELPAWPIFDESDRQALLDVLESRTWGGYHQTVGELERRFAEYHGAKYGIATANGTVSLEIALIACGIRPGDEVIVPPITFVASATAIARVGAVPVFVDVDPQTINLNPEAVEEAINERTRAIVLVHFAGCPADLDRFTELCERHNLVLIEDCAHAHGAAWKGRRVGSFGQFGSFSFQASKNMTAGEGGILTTNNAELAESARSISNQGRRTGGAWYEHVTLGTNARLTGFQAALLLRQLERLPRQVATRMERAACLREGLKEIGGLAPTPEPLDERVTAHGYHLFSMRLDEGAFDNAPRSRVIEALQAEGLPVTSGYPHPIYRNELFKQHAHIVHPCPEAEAYCKSSVWLPHNALLADEEWIDDALAAMRKVRQGAGELPVAAG
ncbi:MAG TPA: DegT/DnrJ/EryC1/StrS family aminotransferase [Blastocatellia bacterium]|jgi:dTDP-4-amino-4,6-dideoxygalactose transaminase|nr:DegT/DnrJ/EryC1/StrS family aminotransferase [Blastocatellia bacterium]